VHVATRGTEAPIKAANPVGTARDALLSDLREARGLDGLIELLGPEEDIPAEPPIGPDESERLVNALKGQDRAIFGRSLPFCGRREALEAVYNAVREAVAERRLHVVEIVGSLGLGKTRVLAEALSIIDPETRGIDVLPIAVKAHDGAHALLAKLVRRRFGITPQDSDKHAYDRILEALEPLIDERQLVGHARLLGHLAGLRAMGPSADALPADLEHFRRQAHKALVHLMKADLARAPRILVLQRASRLDEDGVDVLKQLLAELTNEPLVFAVLGDDLPADFATLEAPGKPATEVARARVLVDPLTERDLERLVEALFAPEPRATPEVAHALIRNLIECARGNPRLLLESARLLVQTGRCAVTPLGLVALPSAASVRLPLDLDEASRLRVAALTHSERWLLQVAAVIGRNFSELAVTAIATALEPLLPTALGGSNLTRLIGSADGEAEVFETVSATLTRLHQAGLLRRHGHGGWVFSHTADRARLLDDVPPETLTVLNALAGQWCDAHLRADAGAELDPIAIAAYWTRAHRPREAAQAFMRAAEAARRGLDLDKSRALYRQALRVLGLHGPTRGLDFAPLLSETMLAYGDLAFRTGRLQEARLLAVATLEVTRTLSPEPHHGESHFARAWLLYGRTLRLLGTYEAARSALDIASDLFRRAGLAKGAADALTELARTHWVRGAEGGYDRARDLLAEALVVRRSLGEPRPIAETLGLLANIAIQKGDLDGARTHLSEARSLSHEAFDLAGEARAQMALGAIAFFRGERETAIETWKAGLASAEIAGERELIGAFLNNIGEARTEIGDYEHASAALMEAREITSETGDLRTLGDVLKNLAILELKRGALPRAQALADEAVALGTAMNARPTLGPSLRARGEVRSLRAQREELSELIDKATSDLEEARAIFEALGDRQELERTDAALAEHRRRFPT
jgi:tetratricopeptide (TPR) repeat protein